MSKPTTYQYPIIELSDPQKDIQGLYNTIFKDKIDTFVKKWEPNVIVTKIKNSEQKDQREIIISNYIIPLCYLIYSFIYTKFFNLQIKKNIQIENDLNYEMYKFFFKHNNPIIKKVNVIMYMSFQKETQKDFELNIIKIDEIKTEKNVIINFLDYMSLRIVEKNNFSKEIKLNESNHDNISNIIIKLNEIMKLISDGTQGIKDFKVTNSTTTNPTTTVPATNISILIDRNKIKENIIIKDIPGKLTIKIDNDIVIINNETKSFNDYLDDMKSKMNSITSDPDFNKYKNNYEKAFKIYLNILDSIKEINISNAIEKEFLDENNINLYDLFKKYDIYNKNLIDLTNKNKNQKDLLKSILTIKNNLLSQNEIYEILLNSIAKKSNNKNKEKNKLKINSYLGEINDIHDKILTNIIEVFKIIHNFIDPSVTPASSVTNISLEISFNNKSLNDQLQKFYNFLRLFFICFYINENNEFYYFYKINNKNINEPNLKLKDIEEIKLKFDKYFRNYKKNIENSDNTQELLNKKLKKIDNNLKSVQGYLNIYTKNRENNISSVSASSTSGTLPTQLKNKTQNEISLDRISNEINTKKTELAKINKNINDKKENIVNIGTLINKTKETANITNIKDEINKYIEDILEKQLKLGTGSIPKINSVTNLVLVKDDINNVISHLNGLVPPKSQSEINTYISNFIKKINEIIKSKFSSTENRNLYSKYTTLENEYSGTLGQKNKIDFNISTFWDKADKVKDYIQSKIDKDDSDKLNKETEISNLESKKNVLNAKIMFKNNEKSLLDKEKTTLEAIKTEITSKISILKGSIKNNEIKSINKEQEEYNKSLDTIYNFASQYEDKIRKISFNKSINRITYSYDKNEKFIVFINEIKKITDKTTKENIDKITLKINKYYADNNDIFISKINEIVSQLNNDEAKPFFEQYQKLYLELIKKINTILDKISNQLLNINTKLFKLNTGTLTNTNTIKNVVIDAFKDKIIKSKVDNQNKITKNGNNYNSALGKNEIVKGKFTEILIYTDNLFYYFLDLLIIIDYLTFFYI